MNIKIIILFFLCSFLLLSCNSSCNNAVGFAVADLGESRTDVLDSYSPECSIILEKSCYNTLTGKATLCIPVPKGHALKLTKRNKNTLHFISYGAATSRDLDIFYIKIEKLSKAEGAKLKVFLWEQTYDSFPTDEKQNPLSDKKKGTEISGHPLAGCSEDGSGSSTGRCIEYQD